MPGQAPRRFVLIDGMILVAATAVGFALLRVYQGSIAVDMDKSLLWQHHYWGRVDAAQPLLWSWTMAAVVLRLRRPRPEIRRLLRQPGAVACWVGALITVGMGALTLAVDVIVHRIAGVDRELNRPAIKDFFLFSPWVIGAAVASAWMILWLDRRWRAEPSWVDRLGRVLGVLWIALAVATYSLRFSL